MEIFFNIFFNLENILSSLTVNNYMIINSILFQPLLLGAIKSLGRLHAIKILLVRTKLLQEKESLHILLIRTTIAKKME